MAQAFVDDSSNQIKCKHARRTRSMMPSGSGCFGQPVSSSCGCSWTYKNPHLNFFFKLDVPIFEFVKKDVVGDVLIKLRKIEDGSCIAYPQLRKYVASASHAALHPGVCLWLQFGLASHSTHNVCVCVCVYG